MQKLHTSIFIRAPREKVWDVMLSDASYREWTKHFSPGSYYKGEWKKGSKMLFLGPHPENPASVSGMVSYIDEARKPEFVSIRHVGIVSDGVEDTESPAAKQWAPSFENYTFAEKDGGTELSIDMQIESEHKQAFEEMWGEALKTLKALAERS